jgi:hypothetical protein
MKVFRFWDDKISHKRPYCNRASVLANIGFINADPAPVRGVESAPRVMETKSQGWRHEQ